MKIRGDRRLYDREWWGVGKFRKGDFVDGTRKEPSLKGRGNGAFKEFIVQD